ncbi:MAG: phenylacetate--CoA ligase family protein [Thermus sp.]|uniref:phenylacetate--CoA ligase family protein n=1 Tax=Thermus sp. TaxID=275 RepID=UPI0025EBD439|nr:AMP-binding protein [Thermus sp.]MCS6867448.1 phenylacetate--CoA ligase family protein [Thermus sp.]MCS7218873.1 phenylacetate--CoA ligase family protein [Thermus sp.]MCX7850344.1 phenylacetate--CoA ligase family protein [Thermus sp.]MDW8016411.1 phenylacetate--CoA ligase family protein [Thermus sp.]MDW8357929.1 phenylacetate--CoA ligase family protein [Thermus sp.]
MERIARLREVIRSAKAHPVYREKLKDVDPEGVDLDNLHTLPLTTREEWVAYLKAHPQPPEGASLMHLTPSPLMGWMPEYLSQEDLRYQTEALAQHYRRLGLVGKRVLVAFSYHVFAGGWLFHQALWRAGNLVFPHGPGEAARIAEIGQAYGFEVLVTNPSFALKVGQAGGRFPLLLAGGEPFTSVPGFRERVEAALGGVALDAYGTSELGIVAGESLAKDGLWEIPEMAVLEVLDPETLKPVPDGEKGELVVTALSRTLMPMVRFRTGDLAIAERREGLTLLPRGVFGRTDLMVKVKGVKLYPTELAPILGGFGLDPKGFQVVVERKLEGTDKLVLRLKAEKVPPGLLEAIQRATGLRVDEVELVGELEGGMVLDRRF